MVNITLKGINKVTEEYFGLTITQELLDVIINELEFYGYTDENDASIYDTDIRSIIINAICGTVGCAQWPLYGDDYGYDEWLASFEATNTNLALVL